MHFKIFTSLAIFFLFGSLDANELTNRGKEFYFAYMPNYHNHKHNNNPLRANTDSLYVFISADKVTNGILEYYDNMGNLNQQNINITNPNEVFTLRFMYRDFELVGQNNSGRLKSIDEVDDVEIPIKRSFHLSMNDDVTLVIHNQSVMSSDACLIYPKESLGLKYFVFSYKTSGHLDNTGMVSSQSTPSQFLIVATEDNTEIEIEPSAPTFRHGLEKHKIILDRGDAYLVQAAVLNGADFSNNIDFDLTGTKINATKPITLLGGHQRADVPIISGNTRDLLMSQMIPLESWGRNVFIVPFADPPEIVNNEKDYTKITVAYDDTKIFIGGDEYAILNSGEHIMIPIEEAVFVGGDKPIRACIYKRSNGNTGVAFGDSDPFMVLFPPKEQFLREYKFINVQANQYDESIQSSFEVYTDQFINVIIPQGMENSLRLDGNTLTNINFTPIRGSDFLTANIGTTSGSHSITADTTFGLCVYGYGNLNSYGYVGGLGLEKLDYNPPQIETSSLDCFKSSYSFIEQQEYDTGIELVEVYNEINIRSQVNIINPYKVEVFAELENYREDGLFLVRVRDSASSVTRIQQEISGFTISIEQNDDIAKQNEYFEKSDSIAFIDSKCFEYEIRNYGNFPQTIQNIVSRNILYEWKFDFPQTLMPGESIILEFCLNSNNQDTIYLDTLTIIDECEEYPLAIFKIYQFPDNYPPRSEVEINNCNSIFDIVFLDDTKLDYGIEKVEYNIENLELSLIDSSSYSISYNLIQTDPYSDSYYKFIVTDLAGNQTILEESLPGFTLNLNGQHIREEAGNDITPINIGSKSCELIEFYNYGNHDMVFDNIKLRDKLVFSIPPSQFPFIVESKKTAFLEVCFSSTIAENDLLDYIELGFNCLDHSIELKSTSLNLDLSGESRCKSIINLTTNQVPSDYEIGKAFPNPSTGDFSYQIGVPQNSKLNIYLIDYLGNSYKLYNGELNQGYSEIKFDIRDIPSGYYSIITELNQTKISSKLILQR